jgi:hypothetical protein
MVLDVPEIPKVISKRVAFGSFGDNACGNGVCHLALRENRLTAAMPRVETGRLYPGTGYRPPREEPGIELRASLLSIERVVSCDDQSRRWDKVSNSREKPRQMLQTAIRHRTIDQPCICLGWYSVPGFIKVIWGVNLQAFHELLEVVGVEANSDGGKDF